MDNVQNCVSYIVLFQIDHLLVEWQVNNIDFSFQDCLVFVGHISVSKADIWRMSATENKAIIVLNMLHSTQLLSDLLTWRVNNESVRHDAAWDSQPSRLLPFIQDVYIFYPIRS
jgi:hypothetical protein